MNAHQPPPAFDALALYSCIETRFASSSATEAPKCECGADLTYEDERESGRCLDCLAEAAGCSNAEPLRFPIPLPYLQMKGLSA